VSGGLDGTGLKFLENEYDGINEREACCRCRYRVVVFV